MNLPSFRVSHLATPGQRNKRSIISYNQGTSSHMTSVCQAQPSLAKTKNGYTVPGGGWGTKRDVETHLRFRIWSPESEPRKVLHLACCRDYIPQASKLLVWYFSRCVRQLHDYQYRANNSNACSVYCFIRLSGTGTGSPRTKTGRC